MELPYRRSRQQERLQYPVCYHLDWNRLYAFVIVIVVADQIGSLVLADGGIKVDADETGKHFLPQHLGECLTFRNILLTVSFYAMSKDLVKENSGSTAGENRGTDNRLGGGSVHQSV